MNNEKNSIFYSVFKAVILTAATSILVGYYSGSKNFTPVLTWWVTFLLIGIAFHPIILILFRRFHDNGWIFGKTIGLAVSAWVLWYLSSLKLLKFTQANAITVIVVCGVINLVILKLYNSYSSNPIKIADCYNKSKIASMINAEAIFYCVLLLWCFIKGCNPSAYGTEKFMDYGYITAILKSEYMPAHDLWFAGKSINYYYVGQYISAFLIKTSGVGPGFGYNLMMMTLAATAFSAAYSIGYNVMAYNRIGKPSSKNYVAGLLSGLSLTLAGNMHFPIFKWIMPKLQRFSGQEVKNYWFADATRYIGYNPDIDDKTIHEFPSYSFVLGDLHAHVINIIFVLTVVALLFAWLVNRKPYMDISKKEGMAKPKYLREIFSPWLIVCMFFIGLFNMTNFWDLPIYYCVCGSVILFSNLITYRYKKEAWILTGLQGITFVIVWQLVALPFTLSFDSISSSINLCSKHTLWYQYLVLWGLPIFVVMMFYAIKVNETIKIRKQLTEAGEEKPGFLVSFFDSLSISDLFAGTIALCALGLIIIPEVVYVVDIYGGAYQRANTMFKLVYQAFMLFALAMSYIIIKHLYSKAKSFRTYFTVCLVLLCCTICYIFEAYDAWFAKYYDSLDASAFLSTESADDKLGIEWINNNVPDDAVVVEMCGLSYTFFNRISVFTGNQTILGWQTHEWLWRSSGQKNYPPEVTERHNDVITLYTSESVANVRAVIEKYDVDYIYVGEAEHCDGYASVESGASNALRYHGGNYNKIVVNDELLKQLGEVIVISPATPEKAYETYIVKVDREKVIEEDYVSVAGSYRDSTPSSIEYSAHASAGATKVTYTYDDRMNCITEFNYEDGSLVDYYEYTYTDRKPTYASHYDSKGNMVDFTEYREYDSSNRCTLKHCFANNEDQDWLYTVKTSYNSNGSKANESIAYPDGTTYSYVFNYDENDILISKSVIKDEFKEVETYVYENDGTKINKVKVTNEKGEIYYGVYKY